MPESGQPIAAGTRLPSERELTAALEVSRTTVANACAVLLEHEFLTLGVPELRELVDVALGWTAPGWTRDRAVRWQRCSRRATSDLGAPVRAVGERLPDLRLLVPSGLSLWRERPEGVGATRVATRWISLRA